MDKGLKREGAQNVTSRGDEVLLELVDFNRPQAGQSGVVHVRAGGSPHRALQEVPRNHRAAGGRAPRDRPRLELAPPPPPHHAARPNNDVRAFFIDVFDDCGIITI